MAVAPRRKRFAERRKAVGHTQESLAARLGVDRTTVVRWERGDSDPQPWVRRGLADVLEVSVDELARLLLPDSTVPLNEALAPATSETAGTGVPELVTKSRLEWLRIRRFLGLHRFELTQLASKLYPVDNRLGGTGILIPPSWRLARPVDLADVTLAWREDASRPAITGNEREARPVRPLITSTRDYTKYHRAMRDLARPRLFENRLTYRLLDVRRPDSGHDMGPGLGLTLGDMCYFDMIDVGETLAHEIARATAGSDGALQPQGAAWSRLPFRRLVRNPFELQAYPLMVSVSTLTIRLSRAGATFFLLRRNPTKVAIAGGMLSVFPTGVFQPASVLPAPNSPDFDLWRNVMREYSEEFLGNPEHDGDGLPIDYDSEEPFRTLDAARRAGRIRALVLGIGIDALNYVSDLLTAVVFDAEVFDATFGEMVEENDEGEVDKEEFTFDESTVRRILAAAPMAPSGAACLHLAWQHRDHVLNREA